MPRANQTQHTESAGLPDSMPGLVWGHDAERLLQAIPDIVYEIDMQGRLVRWNRQMQEVTGYTAQELMGKDALELFPPDERELHAESMKRKIENGYDELESHLLTKDGRLLLYHWVGASVKDDQGRVVGITGTARDVTERRRLEDQVVAQNKRLMELDRLKNTFVNAVSHELRTPLTSIKGYTEFLEDRIGGPLTSEQAEFVHQIDRNTRRLARLVDDLLDFARLEAGSFKLARMDVDLRQLVDEVVEGLQPQALAAQVRLTAVLPHEEVPMCADSQRIEQVLVNLIHNALKFTPAGGHVTVTLTIEPSMAKVEVKDSGVGIAREHQSRLFDKFYQVTPDGGGVSGAGLGLFISKSLVAAHGGTIGVESEPGRGACFWFTLPTGACPRLPSAAE